LILHLIKNPAYLFTDEFLVNNIYGSFINNTCKLEFLFKSLEWYKDTEMKVCNITQGACKPLANFLLTDYLSADVIVQFVVP